MQRFVRISSFQTSKAIKRVTGEKQSLKRFKTKKDKKHKHKNKEKQKAKFETL